MEFKESVDVFLKSIKKNKDLIIKKYQVNKKPADPKWISPNWEDSISRFYSSLNGFELVWKHFDYKDLGHIAGMINILSAEKVSGPWDSVLFQNSDPVEKINNFKIIDFFSNECAVGFYDFPGSGCEMHLYFFEAEPIPLNLNFEGYLKLLIEAKGFFYWQQYLAALITGVENQESEDFKKYMPELFSDFSINRFAEIYEKIKIRK